MKVWYDSGWSRGMPTYSSMLNVMTSWGVSLSTPGAFLFVCGSDLSHFGVQSFGFPGSCRDNGAHLERDLALLVKLDKAAVHGQRGGAGREAEDEVRVLLSGDELVDAADNVVGDVGADLLLRVADSETHDALLCLLAGGVDVVVGVEARRDGGG